VLCPHTLSLWERAGVRVSPPVLPLSTAHAYNLVV
jgi:hypothetical protein